MRKVLSESSFPGMQQLEDRRLLSVTHDVNGWTVVSPSADTRVIYVSSSDGSDLNSGLSASAPLKTIAKGITLIRTGMPDWLLLKRGDTFQENLGGAQWEKSGRSPDEPLLVSAYGTGSRPLLETGAQHGIFTMNSPVESVAIIGLAFHGSSVDGFGVFWLSPTNSLLIEDSSFDNYGAGMVLEGNGVRRNVTIRRDMITNSASQGIYTEQMDRLTIEENVLDHNGWNANYASVPSVRKHGMYIKESCTNVIIRGNIIANSSSHGVQARSGGIIENNLFLNNPIGLSYGLVNGSPVMPGGITGRVTGNVFLGSRDIGGLARGWAMEIANIKPGSGAIISDNIIAHDTQTTPNTAAIWLTYGSDITNVTEEVGINDLTLERNIVYDWYSAMGLVAGLVDGGTGAKALNRLTVRDNDFSHVISSVVVDHGNVFGPLAEKWIGNSYNDDSASSGWFRLAGATTSLSNWLATVDPTGSGVAPSYADPTRTMARYNASLGGLASDGEFVLQARLQSRDNWRPAYSAYSAIDYIKQGFATHAVLSTPTSALETSESGGTATLQFTLSSQPTANVVVPISSSKPAEASVSTASLTFTAANWNIPQTVTVTGLDDNKIDQDVSYLVVIGAAQSTDTRYNGADAADVALVNKALVPTITLGGLALGMEASAYTLGLSATGMGTVTSWSINWGDGAIQPISGNPSSVTHTYADNGIYNITATATSSQGSVGNSKSLTVSNVAPTLTITGASSANESSVYTLSLSSHDPASDTVSSWKITWGDGSVQTLGGNPASVTHTFADSGSYTISATATDEDGTYSANTKAVTINNVAPTLTLSGAGTVNQNSAYAINFNVSDPGPDVVSAWSVNWGDGQITSLAGAARTASHTYTVAGTFTITLSATDEDGTYSITGSVGVADSGGASISGAATSNEGAVYTLNLSTTNSTPISWLINWGDGGSQLFNGNPSAVTHTYADNGSYTITATLNAASGTYNTSKTLAVANMAPVLTLSGAASANEGSLYTLNLAGSDIGPDTISSWRITWGDGSVQTFNGNPSSVTHTFADNGAYTVTATATDEDGTYSAAAGKAVTINKVDPVLNMSGNGTVNQGSPYAVGFSVTDVGADTISSWTINWGDGQSSVLAGSARAANHSYSNTGNFTITLTATDEDGSYNITRAVKVVATTGGVSISGATTSNEGSAFTLLLSSNSASTVSWLINWGDGSSQSASGASPSVNHTFADNGTYSIHATATIDGNTFSSNTISLNVRNVTPAITVSQNTALSAGANQVLNLVASDPGLLDTIAWSINWGDGVTTTSSGLSSQVNHTYPSSTGNYVVAVTASDKDGGIASTTQYLTLNNSGPVISLTGNGSSPEGGVYNLGFAASGAGASTISGWTVNWGDGSNENFAAGASAASHLYADNGAYELTISATYDGGTSVAHKNLIVSNLAPTLTLGGSGVVEGSPFVLSLASSDPGNDHIISWMINWGDGAQTPLAGTATSASHTYADDKIYNVVVTANDEDGYYSSVKPVTISNAAPTLFVSGAGSIERGSIYTLSLLSADAGADAVSSWMIDWGDGSAANVTEGFANLTHVYQTEGSFTISAKATDEDGQWQANPLGVTVTQQTHNLTPVIDFEAVDMTESADWYYFTVTFNYPDISIVPDVTHVLVTGPNDFSATAVLETLVGEDADTTFVATYRIAPADGHWDNADNGTYSVSLTAGGITSPAAGALGTFQSAVPIPDTIAPTVVSFTKSITTAIGAIYKFTIHYTDDSGLFMGDFDNGDLVVTGPNAYSAQAKFLSVDLNNNVTYSIVAPGGLWNSTDNGTYNITLADNAVHDAAGNALAGGIVGNISVNIGDIAGNTMPLAKNLKLTRTSKITLTNFVGSSDNDDYFKVVFTAPVNLSFTLGSSGSFARLRVMTNRGKTLKNLNSGAMSLNLNAGTYFIRLYSVNNTNTVYKTKLVTKATFSTTSIAA